MPIDPQIKTMLDQAAAAGVTKLHDETPEAARRRMDLMTQAAPGGAEEVGAVEDRSIPGPAGQIPVRVYSPNGEGPFAVLLFFHAGGWVLGGLQTEDRLCRAITNRVQCVTVSVDYRLAPENKFPAAADDAYAAARWVAENAAAIGGDPARIAVSGESAGGNLAAVVALMARDRRAPTFIHQLLICPVIDAAMDTRSFRTNAEGYLLTRADMIWFWRHYLDSDADRSNPYASPLRARSHSGLPPALVITAEFDPLRDEGEAYAVRLRQAGVTAACSRYDGAIHGFVNMFGIAEIGTRGLAEVCSALGAAFGTAPMSPPTSAGPGPA